MRHLLIIISIFCFVQVSAQSTNREVPRSLTIDLKFLSSDALEGRETGSSGEIAAGNFLIQRFQDMRLEPMGEDGKWTQTFSFKPKPPVQKHGSGDTATLGMGVVKEIHGRNIIGYMDNGQENTIVIGAHYDHLGWGADNSLHTGEKEIHNGADDNASGVGAMLMLIEKLQGKNSNNNYLFMAFSGEEKGLWGSNYFTKNPTIDLSKVTYMLNMDMVGRLKAEKTLAVYGVGTSPLWMETLEKIDVDSINIVTTESGVGPSDHTSFYLVDIPVLHFFTGQHEDYHKPSDDYDKINFEGIVSVVDYIETLITLLNEEEKLEFTKTKDEKESKGDSFKVTLGVIPDYLHDGEGLKIDGTKEDRPAAKAGIIKGDILIQIDDKIIDGMMAYVECLGIYSPGDKSTLIVLRGEEKVELQVTWDK